MQKKVKELEIAENDYFIWCLLNQLVSNDEKINKEKDKFLKLLELKMFKDINVTDEIKDFKLALKIYYK